MGLKCLSRMSWGRTTFYPRWCGIPGPKYILCAWGLCRRRGPCHRGHLNALTAAFLFMTRQCIQSLLFPDSWDLQPAYIARCLFGPRWGLLVADRICITADLSGNFKEKHPIDQRKNKQRVMKTLQKDAGGRSFRHPLVCDNDGRTRRLPPTAPASAP